MANDRLFRETTTFLLAYPEAFADKYAPTAAELNNQWTWASTTALVHNLTQSLNESGTEFTLGNSDKDDSIAFSDRTITAVPTFYNPTVVFEAFRDESRTATGEYNEALNVLAFPDIEYIAILRLGKANTTAFASGDRVKMVGVKTDYGIDTMASGENIRIKQTFLPNDFVNWNYKLVA
jgi:hypothetical protein